MLKFSVALLSVFCLSAVAQQAAPAIPELAKHSMDQKLLLEKMEKAIDPKGLAKTWKTMIVKMKMIMPMQQIKIAVNGRYKFPDKSKIVMVIPGMPSVTQVLNGKQAWKETTGLGIQMKAGVHLAFAKFECEKSNPALKITEIYEKVTLDPYLYKVGKFSCYKLICKLPAELNIASTQLFVDNKEFLARRSIENQLSEMGVVSVSIDVFDYKFIKGLNIPMRMDMNMMGIKMIAKIIFVKVNEKIADSEFKLPENE